RAYGMDVEGSRAHGETAHLALALLGRLALAYQAYVGAGAAHVERDEVGKPELPAEPRRPDHAARRPGEERVDRQLAHGTGRDGAAVRLHDARRRPDAEPGHAPLEALEVAVHHRHEARVHGRGRETLELPELRQHLAGRADVGTRPMLS